MCASAIVGVSAVAWRGVQCPGSYALECCNIDSARGGRLRYSTGPFSCGIWFVPAGLCASLFLITYSRLVIVILLSQTRVSVLMNRTCGECYYAAGH
jgi:hypothetical protein